MARYYGKTSERGYGSAHVALRNRLLAAWKPGQPCARCGQPMWHRWTTDSTGKRVSAIDLGHADGSGKTAYAGLEHRRCNRAAGQARTAAILRARGRLTMAQLSAVRMRQWQAAARR